MDRSRSDTAPTGWCGTKLIIRCAIWLTLFPGFIVLRLSMFVSQRGVGRSKERQFLAPTIAHNKSQEDRGGRRRNKFLHGQNATEQQRHRHNHGNESREERGDGHSHNLLDIWGSGNTTEHNRNNDHNQQNETNKLQPPPPAPAFTSGGSTCKWHVDVKTQDGCTDDNDYPAVWRQEPQRSHMFFETPQACCERMFAKNDKCGHHKRGCEGPAPEEDKRKYPDPALIVYRHSHKN